MADADQDTLASAALRSMQTRLTWPSMHWHTEDVDPDAWPHIAAAATDGIMTALFVTECDGVVDRDRCCVCGAYATSKVLMEAPNPGGGNVTHARYRLIEHPRCLEHLGDGPRRKSALAITPLRGTWTTDAIEHGLRRIGADPRA